MAINEDPANQSAFTISLSIDLAANPTLLDLLPANRKDHRKDYWELSPPGSPGQAYAFSQQDIQRILHIQSLSRELGVNLAGVEEITRLQQELETQKQRMQQNITRLNQQIEVLEEEIGSD